MNPMPNPSPILLLSHDELLVSHLSVNDRRIVEAAKAAAERGDDLATWCVNVLAAGTAAVTAAGAGTDLARVDAALDRVRTDVEAALHTALGRLDATVAKATDPTTGDVARAAQEAVNRLAAGVQRILTGSDALLPEASSRALRQVTDGALAEIHRLLDGDRKHLAQLIAGDRERAAVEMAQAITAQNSHLGEVVAQLREALAVKSVQDATAASGPRKGIVYEAQVHLLIQGLAEAAGDGGADAVGTAAGTDGSRKGDVVVDLRSLPNQPRMVVEAKNRPGKAALGSGQWAEELERSLAARSADVAVGVCPIDQMPGSRQVLVIDSRRVVVAWDPDSSDHLVTAVYLLMRMCAGYQRRDAAVSPAELEQHVQAVVAAIAPLDEIQRQAVACRRSAERIDTAAQALRTDLKARIDAMWSRIEEAA
ncbi:hypothetical protein K1X13_05215 [Nocardioides sp. WL0053]|uniref:Uncharacterized protein n=1 Tax=Nocardioides jiangsuensis TaxID=2866161 RepID=A0ABS7RGQ5_9ACTN|nr:hypothetical protein [Nocardioides jiangsuensis]MBY9074218.1 hypothetical protein [Nocardioides jiangsuensis]